MTTKPFRGGRVFSDQEAPLENKPAARAYRCFADGCPMPGTMWGGVTQGGTGERPGNCIWHYGVNPSDIPRVTRVLQDWACVVNEINAGRNVLCGDMACDPLAQDAALTVGWRRLAPLIEMSGWVAELQPQAREHIGDWTRRLTEFLGARVLEVRSLRSGGR